MKLFILTILSLASITIHGQIDDAIWETKKHFLIVSSTKDYEGALKKAKSISEELSLKLDLRNLNFHEESGLTFSKTICEDEAGGYPCYIARGRYDDGEYVSIEWSNAIKSFSKGYYVVIISSQSKKNEKMKLLLSRTKKNVPSAYIKSSDVYMGCMH